MELLKEKKRLLDLLDEKKGGRIHAPEEEGEESEHKKKDQEELEKMEAFLKNNGVPLPEEDADDSAAVEDKIEKLIEKERENENTIFLDNGHVIKVS